MTAADEAPDFAEPVLAWRVWRVARRGSEVLLCSVIHRTIWPAGQALRAECRRSPNLLHRIRRRADTHDAPRQSCECGIYGTFVTHVGGYLTEMPRAGGGFVFGVVAMWGNVVECERGYRAAEAYPRRLYVPDDATGEWDARREEIAAGLEDYGVPVETVAARGREALSLVTDETAV